MNNVNFGGSGSLSITGKAICKYIWHINDGCRSTLLFDGTVAYAKSGGILMLISD